MTAESANGFARVYPHFPNPVVRLGDIEHSF